APAVAPPGQHAAASRPPARTATAPAPRNTPWTARKPRPQAPPRTLASGSFFPFRSSDNQERNEKEPFKHAPTQANRARNTTGGYTPSRVLTPEEPPPNPMTPNTAYKMPGISEPIPCLLWFDGLNTATVFADPACTIRVIARPRNTTISNRPRATLAVVDSRIPR